MKRTSLRKRFLWGFILFAVILIVALSLLVCQRYYMSQKEQAEDSAFSYTRTAAALIDGDRIQGYLETPEKDEYYRTIQHYLDETQRQTNLKYYYVFVPYEDDLVYVWDAQNEDGACDLGDHEDYMEGGKEAVEKIYKQDPPEEIKFTKDKKYGHIASAFSPVFDSKGDPVAVVGVDLSVQGIRAQLAKYVLALIVLISIVTFIAIALFYQTIKNKLLRPIRRLTEAAGQIVNNLENGEAAPEIDIKTGDELETLADAFIQMDGDVRVYIDELAEMTAEKEKLATELNVATNIQASMLPRIFPPFPDRDDIDIYATMDPAKEVGGDFYDFFLLDDDHLGMVIADVSGKGVPAALFMVIAKTLIKNNAAVGVRPAEVLGKVNELLCQDNDAGMFVTVWLGILELSTGRGMAANAGHEHPAIRKADGSYELVVYKHSPAVAVMEGIQFRDHDFTMEPGDTLFVYTDGVTEATNSDDVLFGEDRLVEALNANADARPEELLANVRKAIDDFVGDAPQFDDITMLSLRCEVPDK